MTHTAPSSTHPAQLPAGMAGVQGAPLLSARGATLTSGAKSQLAPFPASPCPVIVPGGCLKNLFYSSRHGGGNDGWCLWQHLSSLGLGDFSACVQPAPGVEHRSLSAPGMEVRAWDGSHLPPPTLSLVPTISLAPCPKGRLGCSALLHEGAWGGEGFLCHNSSTRDPVEFTTLLLNIGEYPSIRLSQCTAAGTK